MPWPVHPNGLLGAQGDNDTYQIERSLRFNSADSAYLNRTASVAPTSTQKGTISFWWKRASLLSTAHASNEQWIFRSGSPTTTNYFGCYIAAANTLNIEWGSGPVYLVPTQVLRDPSSWYHVVFAWDTTQATASNRLKYYLNGSQVTSFSIEQYVSQNANLDWMANGVSCQIGSIGGGARPLDAYLTEFNFIDGQALTPSSFGETDAITGRWKAKAYSGTYGTNGFYLKFADNSGTTATTLGKDSSGNGNNWTPNNFSITAGAGNDSLLDSPTNNGTSGNYATLNPLANRSGTLINGNLDFSSSSTQNATEATFQLPSGKWYWEVAGNATSPAYAEVGISTQGNEIFSVGCGFYSNLLRFNNSSINTGISMTTSSILQFAYDSSSGKTWCGINNTWYDSSGGTSGNPSAGTGESGTLSSGNWFPSIWTVNSGATISFNFGQRPFAYTAPSGFKALCTTNLPTPTIRKPSSYMDVVTYTGTGASNSISSLGFGPDLVWIKNRGGATSHAIYDTTRGTQSQLSSDTTGDQVTSSSGLTEFGSNGFTISTSTLVNTTGTQYVAWAWDQSTQDGFTISTYTGTGANRTISHTLGVAPKMFIVKARTTAGADQGWSVWHTSIANTTYLTLNSTSATAAGTDYWNSTSPTSSVFSVGTNAAVNANSDTYIAYLFAEIEGFSKFGLYTGNGSADGPFIHTGFRPRLVMVKLITDLNHNWFIWDSSRSIFNPITIDIYPNLANAEETNNRGPDFLSNGFKLRSLDTAINSTSRNYIFAAFAESPFKYARAR